MTVGPRGREKVTQVRNCVGWYWTILPTVVGKIGERGALVLRCSCGAEYDFLYIVPGRDRAEELKDGARCGSCYVPLFTKEEHEALLRLKARVMDTEKEAAPVEALLQLLGYRRVNRHRRGP